MPRLGAKLHVFLYHYKTKIHFFFFCPLINPLIPLFGALVTTGQPLNNQSASECGGGGGGGFNQLKNKNFNGLFGTAFNLYYVACGEVRLHLGNTK
ncbi:MAG: hypothetical protein IJ160_14330 [Muribaculaceae bacterium]|nr:hypothetical protein [Muribaculaceae bacterium]